ncbi:hypothetical protein B0A48_00294 [Cryoendolithus antarcticus]|uniref:Amino acid permease/ SLC12A domain-containing protein n=1 Tax=Cryoendolithus antarcticus TaxID=1507870 RepID=A0A1V8TUQ0_9PEZI|nr:hypothetical protein B0A48_00294 [Cryoendolithus antarcticus]
MESPTESHDKKMGVSNAVTPDAHPEVAGGIIAHAVASNGNVLDEGLQRGLKGRHLQMIAFGGVVGASIWYGTGTAVASSSPLGALICFTIIGIDVFFVMQALGEMSTLLPIPGAFIEMSGPWAFYQTVSLMGVVVYGEIEFFLASWKLFCVLGGFLVAILIDTRGIGGEYIGFRYWKTPGPFANGINGFAQTFLLAAVYYCGTEMLALTAAESRNPARDLPKAIKQTFWRILIIFIGLVFFAGLLVPSDSDELLSADTKTGKSPWTIVLGQAGWPGAGSLVNVVMLTAQFSSINSAIYVASRSLVTLAKTGRAPKIFGKTTKNGTPVNAILISNFLGLLALLNITAGAGKVFTYLIDIAGAATFIAWAFIGVTHVRFRNAWVLQGNSVSNLPYKAVLYPYGTYFVVGLNIFLVVISGYGTFIGGFDVVNFVFNYIVLVIFVVLYVFWKVVKKTKWVKLVEIDLQSGRRDYTHLNVEMSGVEGTGKRPWWIEAKRWVVG